MYINMFIFVLYVRKEFREFYLEQKDVYHMQIIRTYTYKGMCTADSMQNEINTT